MENYGIIDLIGSLKANTDSESLQQLKNIRKAINNKKRSLWPNKQARKIYNQLDNLQQKYFKDVLDDMIEELELFLRE